MLFRSEIYEDFSAAAEEGDPDESFDLAVAEDAAMTELSAEEIYELACASTVGVTIPGYAQNIFGQTSASSVTGSGIVLNEDGYILTNYHVIDTAYSRGMLIRVITYDGTEYDAEVVGVETDSDLAVLRIEAEGLVPAQVGDSDSLRVGQTIYAVGNPLGELTYTMTPASMPLSICPWATATWTSGSMAMIRAAVRSISSMRLCR